MYLADTYEGSEARALATTKVPMGPEIVVNIEAITSIEIWVTSVGDRGGDKTTYLVYRDNEPSQLVTINGY